MTADARASLLAQIIEEAGSRGLVDRSLRELATAIGTSHRMLIYHFGSRAGLVEAIVVEIEARQRRFMTEVASTCSTPADLIGAIWSQVSSEEMRPFVRLFFEALAAKRPTSAGDHSPSGGSLDADLTDPWLQAGSSLVESLGIDADMVDLRMGVALMRGLLIDVISTGDVETSTRVLERFISLQSWSKG